VMFWCHGGGFASGGGTLPLYDGTNLSAFGDVVVVNVNHRLNAFGFATPTGEGTDGLSPNVGMLDLVAALRWVKRNIARFGGDPANVTIFGQSGGGAKVSTLLVMPEAQGLFHKAIVQSGSALTLAGRGNVVASTEQLAAKAGVPVAQLATIPAEQLLEALKDSANRFSPFVDGKVIARNPFDPDAPESVRTIPMMIGNTRTEASYTTDNTVFQLDDAGLRARTVKLIGEPAADALIAHYRTTYPGATPSLLYLLIATDVGTRRNGTLQAERKARQGGAPVYLYHFEWSTPVNDYWYSPHAIEIPFVFRNLAQVAPSIGAGPVQAALADKMSAAWVAFARTGNPSNRLGGTWPTYEPVRRQTMVFNTATRVVADPQGSDREAVFGTLGTKSVVRSLG